MQLIVVLKQGAFNKQLLEQLFTLISHFHTTSSGNNVI